ARDPALLLSRAADSRRLLWAYLPLTHLLGATHHKVAPVGTGHRALHDQELVLAVDVHNFQVANCYPGIAHLSGHAHSRPDPRGERGSADGAGRAMEHRAVAAFAASEVVP